MKAGRQRACGGGAIAGKAMEDAAQAANASSRKDAQRVVFGFARVDDDGQREVARQLQLRAKDRLLDVPRREVVVIVQPNLADRAGRGDEFDPAGRQPGGGCRVVGKLVRLMRVDADRKPHVRPRRRDALRLGELIVFVGGQNHEAADQPASRARATTASRSAANSWPAR